MTEREELLRIVQDTEEFSQATGQVYIDTYLQLRIVNPFYLYNRKINKSRMIREFPMNYRETTEKLALLTKLFVFVN